MGYPANAAYGNAPYGGSYKDHYGYGYGGCVYGFTLIVVLFILLIIVGAAFVH
ncbi:YjcZ family sporulation protein [Sporolactobacillus laevolacticus]|uniref:YjcZ family sporulation protein n=1 Tax=Sporolactobacillus laevolacticus TaxID=33018 RepID=UPI0025B472C7|nr:YjcZ family sporulation protein [Sporolactobacillus laevolacticus]MDN3954416.1 YjcZ family sporulation protein [Sporolactobacillus laevolacticus]